MELPYGNSIVIERDQHGYYAYCPELPGCQSQGNSLDEVMSNIREAVELYLETPAKDGNATFFLR
jgi:predicted RNase H-like HicB family nuclease